MPYFNNRAKSHYLPERGMWNSGPVPPTAAAKARIAAEDARVMLAIELRGMVTPDRIAVSMPIDTLARIIAALEGE